MAESAQGDTIRSMFFVASKAPTRIINAFPNHKHIPALINISLLCAADSTAKATVISFILRSGNGEMFKSVDR